MAKYTMELRELINDPYFNLFDFDYDFYTDDKGIKSVFQTKFVNRYLFHEIGFETAPKFKHFLKTKLNEIAPYYTQLYETEIKSKNIEFLLNKDYTETFTKNSTKTNKEDNTTNRTIESTTESNSLDNTNTTSDSKESNIANGVSDVGLSDGKLTSAGNTKSNLTGKSDTTSSGKSSSDEKLNKIDNEDAKEDYTLVGKGNIGTTSSADLLLSWRSILLNIDQLILNELEILFMRLY